MPPKRKAEAEEEVKTAKKAKMDSTEASQQVKKETKVSESVLPEKIPRATGIKIEDEKQINEEKVTKDKENDSKICSHCHQEINPKAVKKDENDVSQDYFLHEIIDADGIPESILFKVEDKFTKEELETLAYIFEHAEEEHSEEENALIERLSAIQGRKLEHGNLRTTPASWLFGTRYF